ncbi:MAG: MoaD/ThiS family protein [Armatimonadota bacterium]|nr:MoaD/ThiS family protein [Armatimonadota bacterium]
MVVTIELNPKLAEMAGGVEKLEVEAATLQDAVIALAKLHRPIGARIFNCEGSLRSIVRVEINGEAARTDNARNIQLTSGDVVSIAFP